jgi:Fe-S-cluster containining protein
MQDGFIRRTVKRAALLNFYASILLARGWRNFRGARLYRLAGACRQTGQCCVTPAIRAHWSICYLPRTRRIFLWWHERVNGFVLLSFDRRSRTFFFRCSHYDPATRRCDSYSSRPGMCRDYPRVLLDQPFPAFFPGCGFRALPLNAEALERSIAALQLPPERKRRLLKDLHLDV